MRLLPVLLVVLIPAVLGAQRPRLIRPTKPPPPPVVTPAAPPVVVPEKPFDIMDWTPRPAVGKAEPWETMKDPEWDEARIRLTDTGPVFNGTIGRQLDVIVNGKTVKQSEILAYKGTAVRLGEKRDACVVFDRSTMRLVAGWTGGYLFHSDRRFGLLNTPRPPAGSQVVFKTANAPGWADAKGQFPAVAKPTAPLPQDHVKYRGHYLHGDRVVFSYTVNGVGVLDAVAHQKGGFVRTLLIDPHDQPLQLRIDDVRVSPLPPSKSAGTITVTYGEFAAVERVDPAPLVKPGPLRWGKPVETKLVKGDESGPFAVDTLTIPYDNPFKALFFCTGLDFLPDGRVAVCTCHGDVWLAKPDDKAGTVSWQRFATGLYQPLGLRVVDGKVVVLERGQLTRLHDGNADGEADFYECVCNDWHTGAGEHSYDTCLETDPQGNFYFFKTGDTELPSGGCLIKVSKDGHKVETYATGFRHPIGLGMSPTGIVTGADQEGNWMPATRVDQYKPGGFYGDMRAHHRQAPPSTYDPPLCWLPREVDNSAGGQVWVPKGAFGPLSELPLHLSYGRCRAFVLLRQEFADGTVQGGVAPLPMQFLSGSCRGRFDKSNDLWVCGLNGWQTAAKADGSLQRVRYTGKPLDTVAKLEAVPGGVKLTFTRPLDKATAENPANYKAAWWNYRWSGEYGSKRWRPSAPNMEGQDEPAVESAKLLDEKTVRLTMAGGMKPVMQMQVGYNVTAKPDAAKVTGSVFLTVHKVSKD
jgi:hypothetical protein